MRSEKDVWQLVGYALALLCLLLLVWVAGHVHPEITSVSAAPSVSTTSGSPASAPSTAQALNDRFAQAVENEVRIGALEDITFVRRT